MLRAEILAEFDLDGVYEAAGQFMPDEQALALFSAAFRFHEAHVAGLMLRADQPLLNGHVPDRPFDAAGSPELEPTQTGDERALRLLKPAYRPVRVVEDGAVHPPAEELHSPQDVKLAEEAILRQEMLTQIGLSLVNNGTTWTRRVLAKMGYRPSECSILLAQGRRFVQSENSIVDPEEARAIASARYDDIYRQSRQSLDLRTAISAQKQWDRIHGLVSEEATNPLGDLADIARLVTQKDPRIYRVIDVAADDGSGAEALAKIQMQKPAPELQDEEMDDNNAVLVREQDELDEDES